MVNPGLHLPRWPAVDNYKVSLVTFLLSIYKYVSWKSSAYLLDIKCDWLRRFFGRDRKILGPVSQQVWHDKDPPCSKAASSERRPKFCSPSSTMVTFPYERNTRKRNVKLKTNKQNCFNVLHYAEIVWTWIQSKYWKLSNEVTISFILQNMKIIQCEDSGNLFQDGF